MITGIRLENFKCLVDTGLLEIAPLTILVGPNSSGKSSLLQALLAGQRTARPDAEGALVLSDEEDFDLGTFPEVARKSGGVPSLAVTFAISAGPEHRRLQFRPYLKQSFGLPLTAKVRFEVRYLRKTRETYVSELEAGISSEFATRQEVAVLAKPDLPGGRKYTAEYSLAVDGQPQSAGAYPRHIKPFGRSFLSVLRPTDFSITRVAASGQLSIDHQNEQTIREAVTIVERVLRLDLGAICHVGGIREAPRRSYGVRGVRPSHVGARGQKTPDVVFAEGRRKISRERLLGSLGRVLNRMGIASAILTRIPSGGSNFSILLEHLQPSVRVNIANAGLGISQLLPILVEVFHARAGSLILLEEPEIHLHPRVQSTCAEVLAGLAIDRDQRFVIETHSEHFIRKLQVLVADPGCALSANMVRVYFFKPGKDGTQVEEMRLNEKGYFETEWPPGFFDESLTLSIEHMDAIGRQTARSGK